jgi:hypothetical protein
LILSYTIPIAAFLSRGSGSDLKNVFWPNLFVGRSVQILEILEYYSGLNLTSAATFEQNPIFEKASNPFLLKS